ncbi:hypothetical protein OG462_26095 [Streptomyces sp. NBC_01077]|uniref:hypothetical protein n=1 Tax=Streptomyces sp. NBC_01077 TaxID=2903746 RepID=UPI003865BC0B|nr:hypothetical protein OG462_26095 [Streptomyces sp. NBC_01077]
MALRSGWLPPTGQTRVTTRLTALGATTPVTPLASRSGILPGSIDGKYRVGGLSMTSSGPMTAIVHHGRAIIQGAGNQGAYPVTLDEDAVLAFQDGDPVNPRLDLVVLRVYDDEFDGLTRSEAALEIVRGEPKAQPVAPATPPLSLPLYLIRVKQGASAGTGGIEWANGALTDLRTTLAGVGGILPVYNNSGVPGSYPGQYQDNDNSHYLQRWDGTSWVAYPKEVGGVIPTGTTLTTGGYTGQFRDNAGVLQRWNGSAWANYQPPVEVESTTTGATALPGWTLLAFAGRRTRGLATVTALVTRNGPDISANSAGNITDELLLTVPVGWRPALDMETAACDGFASGGAVFWPNGQVVLRTWSPNGALAAGRNLRVSATYVL